MQDTIYLIMTKHGVERMRKMLPDLSAGEHAIRLKIDVPDACFQRLIPKAELEIGEDQIITPMIAASVEDALPIDGLDATPIEALRPYAGETLWERIAWVNLATIGDLVRMTKKELLQQVGIGRKTVAEIQRLLEKFKLELGTTG